MSATSERLVRLLADGSLQSGERLAAELGITRAAVWKAVGELRGQGLDVQSVERRGYRLPCAVELLDAQVMRATALAAGLPWPSRCEVAFRIDSTNERLHAAPPPLPGEPQLLFAEWQTAGRGRRGRTWLAPFGSGLTFSLAWSFADLPAELSALSLAAGVCVVRALRGLGAAQVQLKWPNDVVQDHRKLGGLLLQMRSEAGGPASVVLGLGLNLQLPPAARAAIDAPPTMPHATPVTDLAEAFGAAPPPSRNVVAAHVAGHLVAGLARFAQAGFAPFADEWAGYDSLRDEPVAVLRHDGRLEGRARGTDVDGALLVETAPGVLERVHAGDVSLRRAEVSP